MKNTFLVISNMRSGSTWLTTMLGSLPDVFVDRELKWRPDYPLEPLHLAITGEPCEISDALMAFSCPEPIVGSKLTFDPIEVPISDFEELRESVSPDTRIVHLSRNFLDIWLSTTRGYYHHPNMRYECKIGPAMMAALSASADALAHAEPRAITWDREACARQLLIMLKNDLLTFESFSRASGYMCIDYGEIEPLFGQVARFIGSKASVIEIDEVRVNPTTWKLPRLDRGETAHEARACLHLFEQFETLRRKMLPFARAHVES